MDDLDYWRLANHLTIVQAALLTIGKDPGPVLSYVEEWADENKPPGYEAVKHSIKYGVLNGMIEGEVHPLEEYNSFSHCSQPIIGSFDPHASFVSVESLRNFWKNKGVQPTFFFPNDVEERPYMNSGHPRYSPKLAAGILAWEAMENEALLKNKTAKQALSKWLRENAARFDLADDEGKPNETGIDEIAKVANWNPKGGAPRTGIK